MDNNQANIQRLQMEAAFQQLDFARIQRIMRQPIFVDGRNLYEPKIMAGYGFTYRSIGRGV